MNRLNTVDTDTVDTVTSSPLWMQREAEISNLQVYALHVRLHYACVLTRQDSQWVTSFFRFFGWLLLCYFNDIWLSWESCFWHFVYERKNERWKCEKKKPRASRTETKRVCVGVCVCTECMLAVYLEVWLVSGVEWQHCSENSGNERKL